VEEFTGCSCIILRMGAILAMDGTIMKETGKSERKLLIA
jgi:hypothetical protein